MVKLLEHIKHELNLFIKNNDINGCSLITGITYDRQKHKINNYFIKIKVHSQENIKKFIEFAKQKPNVYETHQIKDGCKLLVAKQYVIRKKKITKIFDDEY